MQNQTSGKKKKLKVVTQLPNVLLYCTIMVSFQVKVVTIMPEDLRQSIAVQMLTLSQVYGHHKQVFLK